MTVIKVKQDRKDRTGFANYLVKMNHINFSEFKDTKNW